MLFDYVLTLTIGRWKAKSDHLNKIRRVFWVDLTIMDVFGWNLDLYTVSVYKLAHLLISSALFGSLASFSM